VAVSVAAGVAEEITSRGVLYSLLITATGATWAAVVLASIAFGLGHLVQGWRGAGVVTGFALAFHGLVLLSGSLHLAIVVHVVYDIAAGLSYGRLAEAAALPLEAPSLEAVPVPTAVPL
jgi:membrane protease YdiL (CAAX protease family)